MPYLDEADALELMKLHRLVYESAVGNYYGCNSVKAVNNIINEIAKDTAYAYYLTKYKTHAPAICDKAYDNFGYTSLYYRLEDDEIDGKLHLVEIINGFNIYGHDYRHASLISSAKTMLDKIKGLYRVLYTIPNENMRDFMIEQKILKEGYYPE